MSSALPLRLVPAVGGALLITLAVILFMQSLIERGQREEIRLAVYEDVTILRKQPEPERDKPDQQAPEEQPQEPVLEPLQVAAPTPAPMEQNLEMPALDLAIGDLAMTAGGDAWRAPAGQGAVDFGSGGQDARGYVEVVPYNTRRPNVPDVAWENKINGWVLVAFTVTPKGETRNVRVLDARPRGVFEEKVIAAVEDWRYTLSFKGKNSANLVLTQRVEVRWKDYPQNLPNVD
ncbi:TonB family protein [Halioglobus maricola]|uniref:Protein TonB n=1 Tax=Halioglobus maricola TaxID=2601894 RepID=A0A5P9NJD3_9GAMM|nr:TonB family protein [Halioglobus maricola]QFU75689.1 TonB family protein [Halioglobus maricola]